MERGFEGSRARDGEEIKCPGPRCNRSEQLQAIPRRQNCWDLVIEWTREKKEGRMTSSVVYMYNGILVIRMK